MGSELHYNSINQQLLSILKTLMAAKEFNAFSLIGGTALSLQRGHRESIDIDLFSDAPYDSIDFGAIYAFLCNTFSYVDTNDYKVVGLGKSYYIGNMRIKSEEISQILKMPMMILIQFA